MDRVRRGGHADRDLSVGRREIARLWSVDERTVKREIGALKQLGFLTVKKPGARGRVTTYALDVSRILETTCTDWHRVGPDFAERMEAMTTAEPVRQPNVVPFPAEQAAERTEWSRARTVLKAADPARYEAWFKPLVRESAGQGNLILRAPSTFHADYVMTHMIGDLIRAAATIDRRLTNVVVVAEG